MSNFPPVLDRLRTVIANPDRNRGRIFRGDVRSANWDGGGDLSSGADTDATAGYLIDYSSGSMQVQSLFAEGGSIGSLTVTGNLTMGTGGVFRTAASGQRLEFTNSSSTVLSMFNSGGTAVYDMSYDNTLNQVRITGKSISGNDLRIDSFDGVSIGSSGQLTLASDGGPSGVSDYIVLKADSSGDKIVSVENLIGSEVLSIDAVTTNRGRLLISGNTDVALPDYSFIGDGDTGWSRTAANEMSASAGGSAVLVLDSTGIVEEAWTAPTLGNSWVNYAGGFQNARYRKDSNGVVHIQGMIKTGTTTAGTTVFTLPAGYRPAASQTFLTPSSTGSARTDITSAGLVATQAGWSATWTSIEIVFAT